MVVPASAATAIWSQAGVLRSETSTATPVAPDLVNTSIGGRAAQQCTTVGAAVVSRLRSSTAPGPSTDRCLLHPDAVGTAPASTAGSPGSSTCSTSSAPGTRLR